MRPSKFSLSPLVSGTFSFCIDFMSNHHDPPPSFNFGLFQFMHKFPMCFQCFDVNIVMCHFRPFTKSATRRGRHDALQGAHVQKVSLCVMYFATRFGTNKCTFCECSKPVMFSITFGAHVLQATVCVAPRARRRSAPSRLGRQIPPGFLDEPALSAFDAPRPPRSASRILKGPHGEHFRTS